MNKIGRMLAKHDIGTIFQPPAKIQHMLQPVKDEVGLPGYPRLPVPVGRARLA